MNEKEAWISFVNSGSVGDYLKYAAIKNIINSPEEENELQHRRSCYKRTENQRGQQGSDGTDQR